MSLRARISKAVDNAFNAAGDLAKSGTLSQRKPQSYDFSTNSVSATQASLLVSVVITDTKKASGDGYKTTAIMKSGPDISVYDTLTVDSVPYNIINHSDNDFVIEMEIAREA